MKTDTQKYCIMALDTGVKGIARYDRIGALLEMIEKQGDIVVLDKEHAVAMLMPFTLAASELLNTDNGGSADETKTA